MNIDAVNTPRARIGCVSSDGKSLEALTLAFERAGFALAAPGAGPSDLSLVDLRDKHVSSKKAKALAGVLRQKSPESSIFFLVDPSLDAGGRAALKRFGEVIPAVGELDHVIERCRRMIRLRNIAEEAGERLKTLAALNRLAEFPPIAASDKAIDVLIAGAPGPGAMTALAAAGEVAGRCVCVLSAGQTLRALEHDEFDCAVFLPAQDNDPLYSVTRTMRRHPKYADLPIIHVAENETKLKLLALRGANDFMLRRHLANDLAPRLQIAARRARLLRAMRTFLRACNGDNVRDPASGAFTSVFLAEHGARLCARADQTGRPFSIALIRLFAAPSKERAPGRKALHQAARLINRVTRAEDLTARIGPDTFIVLCPATQAEDARRMALRIEGVLSNTVFHSANEEALYAVNVETAVCARAPGAAIEEAVADVIKAAQDQRAVTQPLRRSPQ